MGGVLSFDDVLGRVRAVGYEFGALSSMANSRVRYREAVPVLLGALEESTDPRVTVWIVRCLDVPWARSLVVAPLLRYFPGATKQMSVRWTVGAALERTWDDRFFGELTGLALDRSFGTDRQMIVLGLGRSKRKVEAVGLLLGLLDDPDVSGHATAALRKLKVEAARPGLERMLGDDRTWVRKEARLGLATLDKLAAQAADTAAA
jgi:hypothetical protein